MLRRKGMLLALVFALSVLLVPLSRAQDENDNDQVASHARIVRLSYAEGSVQLSSDRGVENATMNVPLAEGNRLLTGSNGWAEVQLEDGSTIRLAPSTQLTFAEMGRDSSGGTLTTVDLDLGEAEFNVSRQHDSQFAVTVGVRTILLKHSGKFRVISTNDDPLEIAVFKGEVQVKEPDSGTQVSIKKDETFTLDPNDSAHYALAKGTELDELDHWAEQRDQTYNTYSSSAVSSSYAQSPYQYGLTDLSYYGNYYNVPGYGYCWQPYGAGFGWDPFMNGYWALTPFGWTWVSAYPWGWMPYRYGNWIFVNGHGWMWQPGGWGGWWRHPRVVSAPPGFHPPTPPANKIAVLPRAPGVASPGIVVQRPRRVFNNEDVERHEPGMERALQGQPSGNTQPGPVMDRRPAIVGREPATTGISHVHGGVGDLRREHGSDGRVPAPEMERPAPAVHAHPAPAVVPSHPEPAAAPSHPSSPPASAPHPSTPHSFSPAPSAPHGGGGAAPHNSGSGSSGRPK